MQLFDFIPLLFDKSGEYADLSKYDKERNFFMTNRIMSIMYPLQADRLNHIRIPKSHTLDYWQRNMSNIYTDVPNWVYAKGKRKAQKTKEKKVVKPSKKAIAQYLGGTGATSRELDEAFELFGECVYDPIRRLEKVMEQ